MTSYYLPDPTGKDVNYLQVNAPFYIYKNGMEITFTNSPVFVSSLRIVLADGSGITLKKELDYVVRDANIDQAAMSQAFLEDPQFKDTLVKSVVIISERAVGKKVAVSYQEFYLTQPNRTFDQGTPFEITPDLIKDMYTGLASLKQQVARVSSPVAPNDNVPTLLRFDINAERVENLIVNEIVTVNTIIGAKVIRFAQGAYFPDTVVMRYGGNILVKDVDWIPIGQSSLLKQTKNKSGIYQYALLIKPISGEVSADYHAVGGDVQPDDVAAVFELMAGIKSFLNDQLFVTTESLTETPAFRALNARLNLMENNVRSILSGAPTYGDSTGGTSVRRPIQSVDANFHWYTIASLYKVQGSTDIVTADQFRGRVFLPNAKIAVSFSIDVNLNQPRTLASFKTESLIFDPEYTYFGDTSADAVVYPMFRLVWGQASQSFSGTMLQIGVPLVDLVDQMVVEDLSSNESCWLLDRSGQFVIGATPSDPSRPSDNNFVLPDGVTIWSSGGQSSKSKVFVPDFKDGYISYTGSLVTLDQLTAGYQFESKLPDYFPVDNIKSLVVTIGGPSGQYAYDVEIPVSFKNAAGEKVGRTLVATQADQLVNLSANLIRNPSGQVILSLRTKNLTPAGSVSPLSDLIRYIRAKV